MKFDPQTDHYVAGWFVELPQVGSMQTLKVNGAVKREMIVAAWWTDEPIRDPAIHGRRHAELITRTVR